MTHDEKWMARYEEVVRFIEANHRNPSKHRIEEHNMLNWLKASRKLINAGKMKPERVKKFEELQELMEEYKRVNQYQ
jgi:hypothetical protein